MRPFGHERESRSSRAFAVWKMNDWTSGTGRRWPTAGSGVRGGIRTLIARTPRTPDTVALIEASPVAFAVTSPCADTLATEALSLAQVAVLVRSSFVPFDIVAIAVSWAVAPFSVKLLVPVTATVETVTAVDGDGCEGFDESLFEHANMKTRDAHTPTATWVRCIGCLLYGKTVLHSNRWYG